jgi:hypothetical protein
MSSASDLAAEFESLNESIVTFARGASPLEWRQMCAGENWPVGGVIRHIASGYMTAQKWVGGYLEGKPIPIVQDEIDRNNDLHAAEYAAATVPQTVELLVTEGTRVARLVGGLSDTQLAIAHPVIPGRELSTAQLVKVLIRHSQAHFDSARNALSSQ